MATYQRMIAEMDPTRREEALSAYGLETGQGSMPVPKTVLTVCTTRLRGQLHTILEDMDRYPNSCLEELEAFLTLWDVKPRVEERGSTTEEEGGTQGSGLANLPGIDTQMLNQLIATRVVEALAAAVVTHAASTQEETNLGSNSSQNKACNYKEFRAVMHENFCGTKGAVCFVTLDTGHVTPWSDFKAMFIRKYYPRNEVKQMENELWNLKVKGINLTAYNQHFQELILLCPKMVPNTDRLLERYIEGLPLNIKGNVTSSKPVDFHEAIEMA
ncbi:reverse transcriptase domain-containing protein [Tanacetum coccineum]